eukprot:801179-Pleurochrysis_carterae.AAC.1
MSRARRARRSRAREEAGEDTTRLETSREAERAGGEDKNENGTAWRRADCHHECTMQARPESREKGYAASAPHGNTLSPPEMASTMHAAQAQEMRGGIKLIFKNKQTFPRA